MDVNLHPTKREVGFLHQEELTEAVCSAIQDRLTKSNDQCALLVPSALGTRGMLGACTGSWPSHGDFRTTSVCRTSPCKFHAKLLSGQKELSLQPVQ